MAFCPHCHRDYDEDNDTQPCCGCGHPLSCCTSPDTPEYNPDLNRKSEELISKYEAEYVRSEYEKRRT